MDENRAKTLMFKTGGFILGIKAKTITQTNLRHCEISSRACSGDDTNISGTIFPFFSA